MNPTQLQESLTIALNSVRHGVQDLHSTFYTNYVPFSKGSVATDRNVLRAEIRLAKERARTCLEALLATDPEL